MWRAATRVRTPSADTSASTCTARWSRSVSARVTTCPSTPRRWRRGGGHRARRVGVEAGVEAARRTRRCRSTRPASTANRCRCPTTAATPRRRRGRCAPSPTSAPRSARLKRVQKPGGTLHFVEHGLAPDEKVQRWQHRMEPLQKKLFGGCHLTRSIPDLLHDAGFTLTEVDPLHQPERAQSRSPPTPSASPPSADRRQMRVAGDLLVDERVGGEQSMRLGRVGCEARRVAAQLDHDAVRVGVVQRVAPVVVELHQWG